MFFSVNEAVDKNKQFYSLQDIRHISAQLVGSTNIMDHLFYKTLVGALALVAWANFAHAQQFLGGQLMQPKTVTTVDGHIVSVHADQEGDISMEVIGFAPNQQNVQRQPSPTQFRNSDNYFQGMTQITNAAGGQVYQSAGANMQTGNGFANAASFAAVGNAPSNQNIQQQTVIPQQQSNGPFMNGGGFGNQPNSQTVVNAGPSQIGGLQNVIGGMVPSVTSGNGHLLRDSDEFSDVSVERDLILGPDGQIQSRIHISRDSVENFDTSLEVNFNLLPQIRNLLNSQLRNHQRVSPNNNPRMVFFQNDDQENDVSLEVRHIITNPVFQQQIQEIDGRLKRAPAARSKRLMEKYAQALALSTSKAPKTINNSPFFLSLVISWISVWLIL